MRTCWSQLEETSAMPLGERLMEVTRFSWPPKLALCCTVNVSHTWISLSSDPHSSNRPLNESAAEGEISIKLSDCEREMPRGTFTMLTARSESGGTVRRSVMAYLLGKRSDMRILLNCNLCGVFGGGLSTWAICCYTIYEFPPFLRNSPLIP